MMDILINTYDTMAKILLVEDEVNIASFIERGLREFGHEVYVAYDGAAGWELTQKNDFQLLILDIIMPKMNEPPRISLAGWMPGRMIIW